MKLSGWVRGLRDFWEFAHPKKDAQGKVPGFLYTADDPAIADNFSPEQIFERRVFISFERTSLPLALKFEESLKSKGLEPWRYKPTEPIEQTDGQYTLREIKEEYPRTLKELIATVRRCPAVLFLVSNKSFKSQLCQLEIFAAVSIHNFWPPERRRNEAGIYIVLEDNDVSSPVEEFWSRVYEPEVELDLAEMIRLDIGRLAEVLRVVEEHRAQVYQ